MARYTVLMQRTANAALSVGIVCAAAAAPKREKIYDLIIGSEAAAADNNFLWQLQRTTDTGTSTAYTPLPLDAADAAALAQAGYNHTVEPTYTAGGVMLNVPLNQRATFRWVAAPGSELVIPATANNGIGVKTPTVGAAVVISAEVKFDEQ